MKNNFIVDLINENVRINYCIVPIKNPYYNFIEF